MFTIVQISTFLLGSRSGAAEGFPGTRDRIRGFAAPGINRPEVADGEVRDKERNGQS